MRRLTACVVLAAGAGWGALVPWDTAEPESVGLDQAKLEAMREVLAARGTKNFLVVRRGRIVYEWYAADSGPGTRHYTASLAKAIVGGLSLMLALDDGRIRTDDPAWKYMSEWRNDPRKSKITIRQVATHSSGVEDAEEAGKPHGELAGWKGAFWRQDPDPFSISIRQAPVLFEPGTNYAYSNPGMAALAYAVTAALKGSRHEDIRSLLKQRIMDPLGIPEGAWSMSYGKSYELDGMSVHANWGGGSYTARAVARVGQLMLQRGEWERKPLISGEWVERATSYAGTPLPPRPPGNPQPASGLGWWTNFDSVWPKVPPDAFAGAGAGNQVLLVVPSLDLVVVRNGALLADSSENLGFWGGIEEYLFNPLMEALLQYPDNPDTASRLPYPPSQMIRGAAFAPYGSMVRRALDSDNWPITWADDGHLYTSYGDGWGFDVRTERKLSMGFAKVVGDPEYFHGVNIRSPSGERDGDGPHGAKASGMLMVDGVLYMWVRNLDNSQIFWSEDRGRTWQWGFKLDVSFGCPTFLNFGKNYEGARDGYVYMYSQDGPSAYESYDRIVMARAPKDRILERDAYEFFVRVDASGEAVWTRDIHQRRPVFEYPERCRRMDVAYNHGLGRYLLALGYNDTGGFGIFDAPEPWGPWTTVFHTEYWGLGDVHGYRLPTKWISEDGRTLHLVFSGRRHNGVLWDAFCVRKLVLTQERR